MRIMLSAEKTPLLRGHDQDLQSQIQALEEIVLQNKVVAEVLQRAPQLNLPNWYLGAGCIFQTVWNYLHGFELTKGINDCDLVYYDAADISSEGQEAYIEQGRALFKDSSIPVEIVNEARVHVWYEELFGQKINQYQSVEHAINEWPTTVGIAVKYDELGRFMVYAPYGLNDLFSLTLRPNKLRITEDIYLAKVQRWSSVWPMIKVIPWDY